MPPLKEIEIDYLNKKTKILLPEKYSDFIESCKKTFFISESRSQLMEFSYEDEGGESYSIDEDEYNNRDSIKAKYWILKINEDEEEEEKDNNKNIKEQILRMKKDIIKEVRRKKEKIFEEYNKKLKEKIKIRNEELQKNINKIKEEYINNLKQFKQELKEQNKKSIDEISDKLIKLYENNLSNIGQSLKSELKSEVKDTGKICQSELEEICSKDIEEEINNMNSNIKECKDYFNLKLNESKLINAQVEINKNKNVKINLNEPVKFDLNIKNKTSKNLKEKYLLEIRGVDDDKLYNVNLDLSDIEPHQEKSKEIIFKPNLNIGKHEFILNVVKDINNSISNDCILTLEIVEQGSMLDLI